MEILKQAFYLFSSKTSPTPLSDVFNYYLQECGDSEEVLRIMSCGLIRIFISSLAEAEIEYLLRMAKESDPSLLFSHFVKALSALGIVYFVSSFFFELPSIEECSRALLISFAVASGVAISSLSFDKKRNILMFLRNNFPTIVYVSQNLSLIDENDTK
jgi:hypothetical protein